MTKKPDEGGKKFIGTVDCAIWAEWKDEKFIVTMELANPEVLENMPEAMRDSMTMTVMAHALLQKASEIRREAGMDDKDWAVETHAVKSDETKIH